MRSSRSRSGRAPLLLAGLLLSLTLGTGCARPKSYVVLKLESGTPIADIETVVVDVTQSGMPPTALTYPAPAITIDETHPSDLSVSFSGGQSGTVTFHVTVLDKYKCKVGESADTTGIIKGGNVGEVIIVLSVYGGCTKDGGATDGGTTDGPGVTFPGCDPVSPGCGMGKTCQVNCTKSVGECTAGGLGVHGAACVTNADCAPGSQCFDYAGTGCAVKVCLRFCNNDNGCNTGADAGAPPRSVCAGPVQCNGVETGYHTCTFGCDPREPAATASKTGCPTGLGCFVVADMDQVGCGCAEKTRIGKDNVPCTSASQCAPGYICMVRDNVCRAICRCDATGMTCTAPNDCSASGKACSALTNNTVFGACL